jgi:hypothetical protein
MHLVRPDVGHDAGPSAAARVQLAGELAAGARRAQRANARILAARAPGQRGIDGVAAVAAGAGLELGAGQLRGGRKALHLQPARPIARSAGEDGVGERSVGSGSPHRSRRTGCVCGGHICSLTWKKWMAGRRGKGRPRPTPGWEPESDSVRRPTAILQIPARGGMQQRCFGRARHFQPAPPPPLRSRPVTHGGRRRRASSVTLRGLQSAGGSGRAISNSPSSAASTHHAPRCTPSNMREMQARWQWAPEGQQPKRTR